MKLNATLKNIFIILTLSVLLLVFHEIVLTHDIHILGSMDKVLKYVMFFSFCVIAFLSTIDSLLFAGNCVKKVFKAAFCILVLAVTVRSLDNIIFCLTTKGDLSLLDPVSGIVTAMAVTVVAMVSLFTGKIFQNIKMFFLNLGKSYLLLMVSFFIIFVLAIFLVFLSKILIGVSTVYSLGSFLNSFYSDIVFIFVFSILPMMILMEILKRSKVDSDSKGKTVELYCSIIIGQLIFMFMRIPLFRDIPYTVYSLYVMIVVGFMFVLAARASVVVISYQRGSKKTLEIPFIVSIIYIILVNVYVINYFFDITRKVLNM